VKTTEITAGLAESNGSLLPGLWRDSFHVTCGLTACTPGSAPGLTLGNEYGKTLPFYLLSVRRSPSKSAAVDPRNRYSTFGPLNNLTPLQKTQPKTRAELYYQWFVSFIETYRRQIFWTVLYTLLLFGVFIERGYCKSAARFA